MVQEEVKLQEPGGYTEPTASSHHLWAVLGVAGQLINVSLGQALLLMTEDE